MTETTPKRGRPRKETNTPVDMSLLSAEDMASVQEQAAAQIAKERKEAAKKAALETALAAERAKFDPREEIVSITLDLAEHSAFLMIDGTKYFHGMTYRVKKSLFDVMRAAVASGWDHQAIVDGKNVNQYRRGHNIVLKPQAA